MKITFLGNFDVDFSSESHHKKTLEKLGHTVIAVQENRCSHYEIVDNAQASDLFVWVHTHGWNPDIRKNTLTDLRRKGIPTIAYHLDLWFGLQRQKQMYDSPFFDVEHFFTVDKLMADWLNKHSQTRGHYMPAGVLEEECVLHKIEKTRDVAFVGQRDYHKEWSYRPMLVDWLVKYFGATHITGGLRGDALNQFYASTKVVVGDSCCIGYDYPHYWSDRIYETIGRGGFIIHPRIKGLEEHFEDGKHCVFYDYGDSNKLAWLIIEYVNDDAARERIRKAGHEHVKKHHTYTNRWTQILKQL